MSKKLLLIITAIILILVAGNILTATNKSEQENSALNPIRIGWQIPWSTQGQLVQILKNAEIMEKKGFAPTFHGFAYGAPLNEAALAGSVDVIFTADQPAAALFSNSNDWVIIGRLMYNRVSLYVPPNSPIQRVSDLKGKTVAMPFGAAAQRLAYKAQQDAGLSPQSDVNNINLGIYEQSDLIKDKNAEKWGTIDAMAGFDPTPAILEEKGLIRNLEIGKVVAVVIMSKKYIEDNPDAPERMMDSLKSSYSYFKTNPEEADQWFISESKLNVSTKALRISDQLEPNLDNKSDSISVTLSEEDISILQEAADFMFDQGLIKRKVIMNQYIYSNE